MPKRNPSSSCIEAYKKTAEDLGISEELVRAVIYSMWNGVKVSIRTGKSHGILLHNFGTFEVFHLTLNKEITKLINTYKYKVRAKGENQTLKANFEKDFRTLWSLRQMAIKVEKDKRVKHWYARKIHR